MKDAGARLKHLDAFFRQRRVAAIGPAQITTHIGQRQGKGVTNATINRELATLRRMLRLAYENKKLARAPIIKGLR